MDEERGGETLPENDGDDVLPMPDGGWPNHVLEAARTLKDLVDGVLQSPQNAERNWQSLLESFKSRADEFRDATGKLGDLFELFCVLFLNYWNHMIFSVTPQGKITQICWLRGDEKKFPKAQEIGYERRGQDLTDKGSDVVLRHQTTGHMTLVQCKFRSSDRTAADEGGFVKDLVQARHLHSGTRHGLWMGTDAVHPRFQERCIDIKSIMRNTYAEHTTQEFLEFLGCWCKDTLAMQIPPSPEALMECNYSPRPAQVRQLEGWKGFLDKNCETFPSNNSSQSLRAQMSMWCGTGKTFTAFLMIKEFIDRYTAGVNDGAATIIYFVPSLWLMGQTHKSLLCQCRRNQINMGRWLLVGSDVEKTLTQGMCVSFEFLLSTDVNEISCLLKNRRSGGHNVIISTYNSWDKCAGALKKVQLHPDLVIYDEAHRTVGIIDQNSFKRCISDESFPCRVRLFMTATPKDVRIGDKELGDNKFSRDIVNSMNDPETYGETIADPYTQAQAADAGDIVRSKVIVLQTDDAVLREYFEDQRLVVPVIYTSDDDTDEEDVNGNHYDSTEPIPDGDRAREDLSVAGVGEQVLQGNFADSQTFEQKLDGRVRELYNEWSTSIYADNVHLQHIPAARKEKKLEEFRAIAREELSAAGVGEHVSQGSSKPPNGIISELPEGVTDLSEDEVKAYRDTARCDWLCAAIHIVKAIRDGKYKVVFCFTRTIKQARAFQRRLQNIRKSLAEKYPDENLGVEYPIEHMHGRMNMAKRKEILSRVEGAKLGIVCAAKVLNEGIDIPCCDTVVFLEAKGSVVDIAQCSGRCNRLYLGKKVANIMIPAFISEDEILKPEANDSAGFQVLRKTLGLLCVLDEELRAVLCGGATEANPDRIHRRERKFEIARIGRADQVPVDLQVVVDRLNIAQVLLESRRLADAEALDALEAYLKKKQQSNPEWCFRINSTIKTSSDREWAAGNYLRCRLKTSKNPRVISRRQKMRAEHRERLDKLPLKHTPLDSHFEEFVKELVEMIDKHGIEYVNELPADPRQKVKVDGKVRRVRPGSGTGVANFATRLSQYRLLAEKGDDEISAILKKHGVRIAHRNRVNSETADHVRKKIQILHALKRLGVDVRNITTNCQPADFDLNPNVPVLEGISLEEALCQVKQLRRDKLLSDKDKAEILSTGFKLDMRDEKVKRKIDLFESHRADLVKKVKNDVNYIGLRNWYAPAQYDKPPVLNALKQLRKSSIPAEVYYVQTMAFMTTLSVDALKKLLQRGGAFTQKQFTLVLERSRKAATHVWHTRKLKVAARRKTDILLRLSAIEEQMNSLHSMNPPFAFVPASKKGGERCFVENVLLWCDLKTVYPAQNGNFSHLRPNHLKKVGANVGDIARAKDVYQWLYRIRKDLQKWISSVSKDVKEYKVGDMETLYELSLLRRHDFFEIYSKQDGVANTDLSSVNWLEEIFPSDDISMGTVSSRETDIFNCIDARLRNSFGLQRKEMPADGHCQFHALAHKLNYEKCHGQLREIAAHEISKNQHIYASTLEAEMNVSFDAAVHRIRDATGTSWGGHVTSQALASALNVCIRVLSSQGPEYDHLFKPCMPSTDEQTQHELQEIIIVFMNGDHYDSTEPLPADDDEVRVYQDERPFELPVQNIDGYAGGSHA